MWFSVIVMAVLAAVLSVGCGGTDGSTGEGDLASEVQALTEPTSDADLVEGAFVALHLGGGETPYTATRVHLMRSERGGEGLQGRIASVDAAAGTFTLLGVPVVTDAETQLRGLDAVAELLDGQQVHVRGAMGEDGRFVATGVKVMEPALRGAITAVEATEGGTLVTVLGQQVLVPTDATLERGGRGGGLGDRGGMCDERGEGGRHGGRGRHGGGMGDGEGLLGTDLGL